MCLIWYSFLKKDKTSITQVALFPGASSSHQPYWPARHHTLYKLHISHTSFPRHDVLVLKVDPQVMALVEFCYKASSESKKAKVMVVSWKLSYLVAQLDNFCTDHWLFVMIISTSKEHRDMLKLSWITEKLCLSCGYYGGSVENMVDCCNWQYLAQFCWWRYFCWECVKIIFSLRPHLHFWCH